MLLSIFEVTACRKKNIPRYTIKKPFFCNKLTGLWVTKHLILLQFKNSVLHNQVLTCGQQFAKGGHPKFPSFKGNHPTGTGNYGVFQKSPWCEQSEAKALGICFWVYLFCNFRQSWKSIRQHNSWKEVELCYQNVLFPQLNLTALIFNWFCSFWETIEENVTASCCKLVHTSFRAKWKKKKIFCFILDDKRKYT